MIVEEPISIFCNHPLAGLTPEERQAARVKALGRVLAKIAKRKTGDGADGKITETPEGLLEEAKK